MASHIDCYSAAVRALDNFRMLCLAGLPKNLVPQLNSEIQRFVLTLWSDDVYISCTHTPAYVDILSDLSLEEALKKMNHALSSLISLFDLESDIAENQNDKPAFTSLILSPVPPQQSTVADACEILERRRKYIKGLSSNLHALVLKVAKRDPLQFQNAPYGQFAEQFTQNVKYLKRTFINTPFSINPASAIHNSPYPLRILNELRVEPYSELGTELVCHPAFRELESSGRLWVHAQNTVPFGAASGSRPSNNRIHRGELHQLAENLLRTLQSSQVHLDAALDVSGSYENKELVDGVQMIPTIAVKVGESLVNYQDELCATPRFAVCGPVKAGKSTFLNVLIGSSLLPTDSIGCTSWPTVIRHNENATIPRLRVSPGHFKKYFDILRTWVAQTAPRNKANFIQWSEVRGQYQQLPRALQDRVTEFIDENFELPEWSYGDEEILKTSRQINDLLRVCTALFRDSKPKRNSQPKQGKPWADDGNFPVLEIRYGELARDLKDMEFVDLPGQNDHGMNKSDLEAIWKGAMEGCHGAIMIVPAIRGMYSDHASKEVGTFINRSTSGPKIMIGTKRDQQDLDDWSSQDQEDMARLLFPEAHLPAVLPRILECAPPLYTGVRNLEHKIQLAESTGQTLTAKAMKEFGGPALWRRFVGNDPNTCSTPEIIERELPTRLEDALKLSNVGRLSGYLRTLLYEEAKDQRYIKKLDAVRTSFESLWIKQRLVLHLSSEQKMHLQRARDDTIRYGEYTNSAIEKWEVDEAAFTQNVLESMEDELEDTISQATEQLERVIRAEKNYRGDGILINGGLLFIKRAGAEKYLDNTERELFHAIDSLQAILINKVRLKAGDAWRERLLGLPDYIKDSRTKASSTGDQSPMSSYEQELQTKTHRELQSLCNQRIGAMVKKLVAKKMESSALKQTGGRKGHTIFRIKNPFRARQEATASAVGSPGEFEWAWDEKDDRILESLMTSENFENDESSAGNAISELDAQELFVRGINLNGCLDRAPLSANLAIDSEYGILHEKPKSSIQLTFAELTEYHTKTLSSWQALLKREMTQSITGGIKFTSRVAKMTVKQMIDKRSRELKAILDGCKEPLKEAAVETLISLHANCVSSYGAVDELRSLLAAECESSRGLASQEQS